MAAFIEKYGIIVLGTLITVIVAIIVFVVIAEIASNNKDNALVQLEELEERIIDGETQLMMDEFEEHVSDIQKQSNDPYVRDRIQLLAAQIYWDNDQYEEAAVKYLTLAQKSPNTYLGQLSYFNAAVVYEESGDAVRAISVLEDILTEYAFLSNPMIPRTLLNLGRLHELQGNTTSAQEYYDQLIQNYSGNELVNLAYNRLIRIENTN